MKYYGFKSIAKFPRSNLKNLGFANGMAQVIKSLFANNEQGFAFDFNDLSTMYQDAAGTIPVTGVGQPVGKVLDKSGRGNHATQATSAKRPILQKNATTGAYYLSFDGVDDFLITGVTTAMGLGTTIFGANKYIKNDFAAIVAKSYSGYIYNIRNQIAIQNGNTPNIINTTYPEVFTAIYNSNGIDTVIRANKLSRALANSARGYNYTNPLIIGAYDINNVYAYQGDIYAVIGINRMATTDEITNTEQTLAKLIGVTL